jgi:hypothetical protein
MAADLMRPLTPGDELSRKSKACEYITPNERLTSRERLQIFARSYWYRILDSLYEDFPGVRAIIGDEVFHQLSRAYLAAHPSQSYSMRDLGRELENWLRRRRQYTGAQHELVLDMVKVEWAHIEAFDGASATALGPEDLLELGPELHMGVQPYVSLLRVNYAVDELRIRISRKQDLHETASNAPAEPKRRITRKRLIPREPSPLHIAVHRFDDMVYYRRLEPEAYRILSAIRAGEPIGTAIENGFEGTSLTPDDAQMHIAQWFSIWAQLGWLCRP